MLDHDTYLKLVSAGWDLGRAADRMREAGDRDGELVASDALASLIDVLERHEKHAKAEA